ncbi:hypothetical protein [Sagittula sp. S175]|uniref:hypothetical protein n=1 Tax=Sagittula sp. S175 TaxID=3415129 RepID=UPI003C7E365B
MELDHIAWTGPAIDDPDLLDQLPAQLVGLLQQVNGFIQYGGGLHVRGACVAPAWHALRPPLEGPRALHRRYPSVAPDWIPFAQDCVGDQFLLADGAVLHLQAETGDIEALDPTLTAFFKRVAADPVDALAMQPLQKLWAEGGHLAPGQLLSVYPPFCTAESAGGVSVRPVSSLERQDWLADFARTIAP